MGDSQPRLGDSQTLPRERFMQGHSPSTHLRGGAQPLREQVVRLGSSLRPAPGGVFCGTAAPAPNDARGSPSALPRAGAPPRAPGDFLMRRKSPKTHQEPPGSWTSGEGGLAPFDPPALCPSGIGGEGTGSAASSGGGAADGAADTLSFIQEKNC